MSFIDETRELIPKKPAPEAFVGAMSPLWGFFTVAAAGGVAWWWMSQWTRPQNLEALFGRAADLPQRVTAARAPALPAVVEPELPSAPAAKMGEAADRGPELSVVEAPKPDPIPKAAALAAEPHSIASRAMEPSSEPKSV